MKYKHSIGNVHGLTSSTAVPSSKSTPSRWMIPLCSSTPVTRIQDSPIEFGRCGDRVANTPCFRRGPRGGVTNGLKPWFKWKNEITQQYSNSQRPRNDSSGWVCLYNSMRAACCSLPSVFSVTFGCRGVPNRSYFSVMYQCARSVCVWERVLNWPCLALPPFTLAFMLLHEWSETVHFFLSKRELYLTLYGDLTTPITFIETAVGVSKSFV